MSALGRDWLLANLPHQGAMNLLDAVVAWDKTTLRASAAGHRSPANPLRRAGILPITAGIEYGAQAAAAHGALAAGTASRGGYLASVRAVRFHASRLDEPAGQLEVAAEQLGAGEAGVSYRFEVRARGRCLVEGRLTVAFGT